LFSALACAVDDKLIASNPAVFKRGRGLPKVELAEMATLKPEQAVALRDAVRHSQIYPAVLLALHTGARRGEILAMRWKSVDLDHGVVRIVQSLVQVGKTVRFKEPKTGRARTVTLAPVAVDELRRVKREQAEALLLLGIRQSPSTLVCARRDGEPLQPQSLTHEFPRFLGRLGEDFPRVRFHDLRHTHATLLLESGENPKVVQERLGHTTIKTTLDLYSHVTETMQQQAAVRLDDTFRRAARAGQ
jgi:integrase